MLSSVEAWWAGLCALPFDGAQGDNPLFHMFLPLPVICELLHPEAGICCRIHFGFYTFIRWLKPTAMINT
jgi:hypothetical protein